MNKPRFLIAFAIKVLLGLLYGYIFLNYYNGDDTWQFFRSSVNETWLLLNKPRVFFTNEFTPYNAMATGKNAIEATAIYLNELQYVLLVKTMAFFNLVTGSNYYLNVVLFNAIFFFGHYWLFRLMTEIFPDKKQLYFILIFFFLPAVFWLSGIRVDGLLFFFLSLLLYNACSRHKRGAGKWVLIVIGLIGVIICRPQFAALVVLALIAKAVGERTGKTIVAFSIVYLVAAVIFFIPGFHLSAAMAEKQHEFLMLKGTKFGIGNLDPSPVSYIKAFPQAAANIFFRPLPWEAKGVLQLLASAEMAAFWAIIIVSVIYRHRQWKNRLCQPMILAMLAFGITTYIFISYIVPFPGAYVRYKAIPELLILCAIVSLSRLNTAIHYNKK
ncbi:MAG: hypothetical protein JNK79_16690 [Chitinophagaceae bacterium]|nr:hypothetical protein [Chitinophagaceae bacterium]